MSKPITREEMYLAALGGEVVTPPAPITRMDMYLAYLNGMTDTYPEPITRTEQYLYKLCQNGMGSGGGVTIRNQNKTITENGEYTHDAGYTGLGVVTVNVEASGGGDNALLYSILDRSVEEFNDSTIENIGDYAFYNCTKLTKTILPNVKELGGYAFKQCGELSEVSIPSLLQMKGETFRDCKSLVSVSFENATRCSSREFYGCTSLVSVNLPKIANGVGTSPSIFENCTNLKNVNIPSWDLIAQSTFKGCTSLEILDCPNVYRIITQALMNASALSLLVLRRTQSTVTLDNIAAFSGTPFYEGGTGGTVYVPAALITQYQQATNWATLYAAGTCNFVAIEGSEYE